MKGDWPEPRFYAKKVFIEGDEPGHHAQIWAIFDRVYLCTIVWMTPKGNSDVAKARRTVNRLNSDWLLYDAYSEQAWLADEEVDEEAVAAEIAYIERHHLSRLGPVADAITARAHEVRGYA